MANRLQSARDFNPYEKGVTLEELQQIHRQLAKVLNQRMVRLENTKSPISGEEYTFGAYDVMQDYLKEQGRYGRNGKSRFDERITPKQDGSPLTKGKLQREIKMMQKFEDMPSSQISGMHAIEAKRIETFINPNPEKTKRGGLSPTTIKSKDFYDFLNSATFQEISNSISSDIIVEEYDKAADRGVSPAVIAKAFEEYMTKTKRLSVKGVQRKLRSKNLGKKKTKRKR